MTDDGTHLDFRLPFGAPTDMPPSAFTPDALNLLLGSILCAIKETTLSTTGGRVFPLALVERCIDTLSQDPYTVGSPLDHEATQAKILLKNNGQALWDRLDDLGKG